MIVKDLIAVVDIVENSRKFIHAVYQYRDADTGELNFLIESEANSGESLRDPSIANPTVLYTKEGGWTTGALPPNLQQRVDPSLQICGGPKGPCSTL